MEQAQQRGDRGPEQSTQHSDDAADVARVAALVGRAGLRLSTAEIAQLVAEYRYDRAGFDRLRTMLVAEDETAHAFRAERAARPDGERGRAGEGPEPNDASPVTDR